MESFRGRAWGAAVALLVALGGSARGEPLPREEVPAPLAPWIDWALRGAEQVACPFVHGDGERRQCAWPSRLSLELDDEKGRFRQEWRVYLEAWVPLPGDARAWPEDVRIGQTAAVVVARDGRPMVRLGKGAHVVTGAFRWPVLPELLRIPVESGLVSLELRGRRVPFPDRDPEGRLWLQRRADEGEAESRLEVEVHRRAVDEVPLELEARIELEVSGRAREVLLGRALPPRFAPMSLESPLPARLEEGGRLRVQVRPGSWVLGLVARHEGGPVTEIVLPERDAQTEGPWDEEEAWAFEARNDLRLVQIEGVPGVDPQQTRLPGEWMHLPAYLMKPGSRMRLVERRRGDEDPAPDQLALKRTWWLDFDGGGYTVHDQMEGTLRRSWRLETAPPTVLGRVAIDGQDQFLSRLDGPESAGVEVRQGRLLLDADSRIEGVRSAIPAVGWSQDFQSVSGELNLPPGWQLFHATGVDDVRTTWANGWSLLEIFLVLVTAMIVAHLFGLGWGVAALATLVLIYPEPGAPRWSWLLLLGVLALLRVVPEGNLRRAARLARLGAIAVLAVVAVPFVVEQARIALFPALELPGVAVERVAVEDEVAKAEGMVEAFGELEEEGRIAEMRRLRRPRAEAMAKAPPVALESRVAQYYAPDPLALVSTGPGLPRWTWRTVQLSWRGPVKQDQRIRLLLIPPWGSFVLAWLRISLTALLALRLIAPGGPRQLRPLRSRPSAALLVFIALGGAMLPARAYADIPPKQLLEELRRRLLEPPECFPACAASPRMHLEASPSALRLRVEIDAATATAIPLPAGLGHWLPETVLLDGAPASGLAHSPEGRLWIPLTRGRYEVTLAGRLPQQDTVHIPLPLKPHRVTATLSGWTLEGLREGGEPEESLQLTRTALRQGGAGPTLEPQDLPPFVRVERVLRLGLAWQVETAVSRVTPPGRSVFLEVPLLPGESVTSEAVRVSDGKALVSLPPDALSVGWTSALEPARGLLLRSPATLSFSEVWRVDASPLWHVEASGIPTVHASDPPAIRIREWRPWPEEEARLEIRRPESTDGRTITIDRASLAARPGLRASELTLTLALRASRGSQHSVGLPEGADLQSVRIDRALQPVRLIGGRVVLPIQPGTHGAEIVWRSTDPVSLRYETPAVDPGGPSVNAEIEIAVPADRWVLFVGGPRLGPAVLFWSLLVAAALLAWGLGRLELTPLGSGSWFLLFIGLTQIPVWLSIVVVGWLVALGWRRGNARFASPAAFDGLQVLLALWTGAALLTLVFAIRQGLLGLPDMQIGGNGSTSLLLRWYQDRSAGSLPTAWMISVPLLAYRLAMLAWALWLARALVAWMRWGWLCFSHEGIWRPLRRRRVTAPTRS